MTIEVYWGSGSGPAWRVLLALELKNLDYQSHLLELTKDQQKKSEILRLNPRGQIPILKDGEVVVSESLAIMLYLENRYPKPSLFGETPQQLAKINQLVQEVLSYMEKPFEAIIRPIFRNRVENNMETLMETAPTVKRELELVDQLITKSEWIAGSEISAADIVFLPTFQRLLRAIDKNPEIANTLQLGLLDDEFHNLLDWNNRMQALPAFAKTYPPHWRGRKN
ncbi:glutathione S-transferase family protein [Pseudomonadota bacterium]